MHKIEAFKQRLRQQSSFGPQFVNQLASGVDTCLAKVRLLNASWEVKAPIVNQIEIPEVAVAKKKKKKKKAVNSAVGLEIIESEFQPGGDEEVKQDIDWDAINKKNAKNVLRKQKQEEMKGDEIYKEVTYEEGF